MKKKILSLLIICVLGLNLVGCGESLVKTAPPKNVDIYQSGCDYIFTGYCEKVGSYRKDGTFSANVYGVYVDIHSKIVYIKFIGAQSVQYQFILNEEGKPMNLEEYKQSRNIID